MQIKNVQIGELTEIIVGAFVENELKKLVIQSKYLGERIFNEFSGDTYNDKVFNFVRLLNRRELVDKFLSEVIHAPEYEHSFNLKNLCNSYIVYIEYNVLELEEKVLKTIEFERLEKVFRIFRREKLKLPETIKITKTDDIIIHLTQEHPKTSNNSVSILCLAQLLLALDTKQALPENSKKELQEWIELNQNKHGIKCSVTDENKPLENCKAYLLITVAPTAKKANFRLAGQLLIWDQNQNHYHERYTLELNNNKDSYIECNFNKISDTITQLIDKTWEDHLDDKALRNIKCDLNIELFLPIKYLVEDFDIKPIPKPIGREYTFVVRSYERVCKGKYWNKLLEKWEQKDNSKNPQGNILNLGQNFNWDQVESINLFQKVGMIFCGLPNSDPKKEKIVKLFNKILDEGVIICLWTRCPQIYEEDFSKLEYLVKDFSKVHEEVLSIRREESSNNKDKLSNNLGFMCEDIYRKPEIAQLKLNAMAN